MKRKKVLVIGLDCLTPQLLFDQWSQELPTFKGLMEKGLYGPIQSSVPPITIPAWLTMVTSKNPGQLGLFGFRNRQNFDYFAQSIASASKVKAHTLWDILSQAGRKVCVVGVPPTYPPRSVNGCLVSCFLTPDTQSNYTYPQSLKGEIEQAVGKYIIDVENFRTEDKDGLLGRIYEMTTNRFQVAHYLLQHKEWDFFMMVEMGPDRLHHGFWKYFDPQHRKYIPGSQYAQVIKKYYQFLDHEVGELLREVNDEETAVIVVSDHGAQRMAGCINLNDWLIQEGYLTLSSPVNELTPLKKAPIDWVHTRAWGMGGYYGRIFLNVAGREPQGCIAPQDYESIRQALQEKIKAIKDDQGRPLNTHVFTPQEVYRGPYVPMAPDLIVYLGDLQWRATESIGHPSLYSFDTEMGPDDAMHADKGIFILCDHQLKGGQQLSHLRLLDVAPTILSLMGIPIPRDMEGIVIYNSQKGAV